MSRGEREGEGRREGYSPLGIVKPTAVKLLHLSTSFLSARGVGRRGRKWVPGRKEGGKKKS